MKSVVFVHGFMGSALNWGPILTNLRRRPELSSFQFFAADLLGHGGRRSSPLGPYKELTLELVAQDLWLQCQNFAPFVGIGHSFGFRPLLKLQSLNPSAMDCLVVEDSSPVVDPKNRDYLLGILRETPDAFASRDDAHSYFRAKFPGRLGAFLLSNIREDPEKKVYTWRFDAVGLGQLLQDASLHPLWKEWELLSIPSKIIRGENSDFLSRERVQEMLSRAMSPCEPFEIENSGHWIHSDQPDQFANLISQILSSLDERK